MKSLIVLSLLFITASSAFSQDEDEFLLLDPDSSEQIIKRTVLQGEIIPLEKTRVYLINGSVSNSWNSVLLYDRIILIGEDANDTLMLSSIESIDSQTGHYGLTGCLIGSGLVLSVVILINSNHYFDNGIMDSNQLLYVLGGGLLGYLVGTDFPKFKTIYDNGKFNIEISLNNQLNINRYYTSTQLLNLSINF